MKQRKLGLYGQINRSMDDSLEKFHVVLSCSAVAAVLSVDQWCLKSTDVVPLSSPSFTGRSQSILVRQERQRITSNVEAGTGAPLGKTTHMLIANRSNFENT